MFSIGDRVRVISTHMGENDNVDRKQIGMVGNVVRKEIGVWDDPKLPIGVQLDGDETETYFAVVELELVK